MATSKLDLNVLFVFLSIRWIDFSLFGSNEMLKTVRRNLFGLSLRALHVLIELSGKHIAVADSEDSFKNIDVASYS